MNTNVAMFSAWITILHSKNAVKHRNTEMALKVECIKALHNICRIFVLSVCKQLTALKLKNISLR